MKLMDSIPADARIGIYVALHSHKKQTGHDLMSYFEQLLNSEQAWKEEAKRLQSEFSSHAPEGRNYTNQQYVDLLLKFNQAVEVLEWTKKKYREEWTYEMGTGEVVDEIISNFENALSQEEGSYE